MRNAGKASSMVPGNKDAVPVIFYYVDLGCCQVEILGASKRKLVGKWSEMLLNSTFGVR